jgi:hypothetical protein
MFSQSLFACLALLAVCALAVAQEAPADQDKQVVDSKATHKKAAASVNFRNELGMPLSSLSTLGSRIDAARRAPDPVALAHAANELAVAEKTSGKEAGLTSKAVIKEAAELAKLRRQAAELRVVSHLAQQIANEQDLIANLNNGAGRATGQGRHPGRPAEPGADLDSA